MVVGPEGRASVQAGAGIVADSDPASEEEECGHKAAALLAAVSAAEQLQVVGEALEVVGEVLEVVGEVRR